MSTEVPRSCRTGTSTEPFSQPHGDITMRYLAIYKSPERETPPTTEEMAAMGARIEEMTNAGVLLATEGCLPSARGARVRRTGDKVTVTDGPFTESKELIAGF